MTKHWKHGSLAVELREDGTLSIYQPDTNRVLSAELARELLEFLLSALPTTRTTVLFDSTEGGWQQGAQAALDRVAGQVEPTQEDTPAPVKRRPGGADSIRRAGRPRKTT